VLVAFSVFAMAQSYPAFALAQSSSPSPTPPSAKSGEGSIVIPESSVEHPGDIGVRGHTNVQIFVPASAPVPPANADGTPAPLPSFSPAGAEPQSVGPPASGYFFETPASIACIYGLAAKVDGCNPNTVTANPTGGSKAIAIVDAYDDPNAAADLANFSKQFGLPSATFSVVFASGSRPPANSDWQIEESLDIEWAHAMAPGAKIYLVEAASNNNSDLLTAENVASTLVSAAGGGEVTNSWGQSEFSGETSYDYNFSTAGVVYFASTGDSPGVEWPSTSPNVVAAGGTSTARNPYTGKFLKEVSWTLAGGGVSSYESRPSYQKAVKHIVGSQRGVPDLSADANPVTGVWVLDSNGGGGWYVVGGTSVASPMLAGIVNSAGHFAASSWAELATIYKNRQKKADFTDLKLGFCGPYSGYAAKTNWDFCTGVGSPEGKKGK
jgi:hypothetical protein